MILTEPDLTRICDLLYRQTGILVPENRRAFVERRVLERLRATGLSTLPAYLACLRADADGEVQHFVNAFTVNETYFNREEHQLHCLTESLMAAVTAGRARNDPIRIWSMPCATGEEPYSVALWLLEHWPAVDDWEIEIVGSDIDTRALAAAQAGRYGAWHSAGCRRPWCRATSSGRTRLSGASCRSCAARCASAAATSSTGPGWRRKGASTSCSAATS